MVFAGLFDCHLQVRISTSISKRACVRVSNKLYKYIQNNESATSNQHGDNTNIPPYHTMPPTTALFSRHVPLPSTKSSHSLF